MYRVAQYWSILSGMVVVFAHSGWSSIIIRNLFTKLIGMKYGGICGGRKNDASVGSKSSDVQ